MNASDILSEFGIHAVRRPRRSLADRRRGNRAHILRYRRVDRRENLSKCRSVPAMARRARAETRRTRAAVRRGIARAQGCSRSAGHARSRQNPAGRPRRSSGDDRHLRFRGRSVAPALWPHHRVGTARPSHDGAMAADRSRRDHFRVQFSCRGMGMECRAGARLRRLRDLEAFREDASDRACHARRCSSGP